MTREQGLVCYAFFQPKTCLPLLLEQAALLHRLLTLNFSVSYSFLPNKWKNFSWHDMINSCFTLFSRLSWHILPPRQEYTFFIYPRQVPVPLSFLVFLSFWACKNPPVFDFSGFCFGGDEGDRTPYLLNAIQALSQVSYAPIFYFLRTSYYKGILSNCQLQFNN